MKKLISIILIIIMTFSSMALLSACDSEESTKKDDTPQTDESTKKDDSESLKEAYNSLNKAFTLTSAAMDDIYKSWYFTVYMSGKFDSSGWGGSTYFYIDSYYPEYIGREYKTVRDSFEKLFDKSYTSTWLKAAIKDVSTGVPLIVQILKDEGVYSAIDSEMEKAKEALKGVNKDNDCYEDLMAYYTEMLSFYEFAESPSGSFNGLESTVRSYEKNIQGYKNKLSIYID